MMRQSFRANSLVSAPVLAFTVALSATAGAAPVYLRIESQFPSGHYTRQLLENRTKKVQAQRWFQVETKDKAIGWIPEDQLLNALKLVSQATLTETAPLRPDRDLELLPKAQATKGSRVQIIEISGSWARVASGQLSGWVLTETLDPVLPATGSGIENQILFIPRETTLYAQAAHQGRVEGRLAAASFVTVARALTPKNPRGWLEIRNRQGWRGFIHRDEGVAATDLGKDGARPLREFAGLRSAPLPYAHLSRHIPEGLKLKVLAQQTLRWGLARMAESGEVWWPIADEGIDVDREIALTEKISTSELFHRKIFDMASSPAVPSLKLVSAQGVFRTVDGKEWTKLPSFQDKNYPIAIAGHGAIFVGPYVSDDHGETFQQWIRWDTLIASMKRLSHVSPKQLQIQEIRPEDPAGRRVVLKLSIGTEAMIKVVTDDQGRSWRPL